jgi:uncharacterized membrane protein
MEIRHLFHGPFLAVGGVARSEFAAYALALLLSARALCALSTRVGVSGEGPAIADIARASEVVAWPAIAISALFLCLYASPWWGPLAAPLGALPSALLLFTLYLAGGLATLSLSRVTGEAGWRVLSRAAATAATADLFVLVTLLVRWAFRGQDMRAVSGEAGAETWTFSAVWAVFGLACLTMGAARSSQTVRWLGLVVLLGTVAKVLLFDMARLDGMVRAASFLAVGALLIVGALAARGLGARSSGETKGADG